MPPLGIKCKWLQAKLPVSRIRVVSYFLALQRLSVAICSTAPISWEPARKASEDKQPGIKQTSVVTTHLMALPSSSHGCAPKLPL